MHRRRRRRSRRRRTGAKGNYGCSSAGRTLSAAGRVLERRQLTGPAAMMRVVQPEGAGAAIEGGGGGGGAHRRRSQWRRTTVGTGSAGWTPAGCRSLSQREDEEEDAATVLPSIIATVPVTSFKCVYVTVTHSCYQNVTSVTGIKGRYS